MTGNIPLQLNRIIPCLLLQHNGLVKTRKFKSPVYVGDPINAVRIFSEKCADELIIIDIGATEKGGEPNVDFLRGICSQAFMPVCYGGGVRTISQMERLYTAGVEKVSFSSAALENCNLVEEASRRFGSQSVVVTLDIKRSLIGKKYVVVSHRGKRKWQGSYLEWIKRFEELGVGEILINDVDRDGTMSGYDHDLAKAAASVTSVPVIALGGAKDLSDMERVISMSGAAAAAAGSLFVFKGPHRAVLLNYPDRNY